MFSHKGISRLALLLGLFSWLATAFTDLTILFSKSNDINSGIEDYLPHAFFTLYVFSLFIFFKFRVEKAESINFIDLLWKIFVTGLLTTVASLLLKGVGILLGATRLPQDIFYINFIYIINLGLLSAFVISTLIVWKRLILYHKSKFLIRLWTVFEYALFLSLLLDFLPTSITNYFLYILVILGIFLSVNMKWVAYLSFKQKWKSILLLLLAILYLGYFWLNITGMKETNEFLRVARNSIFIEAIFIFIFIYAIFSLLVILFNLPTTSVFEQKLAEVVNFQRLSQSIQTEQNEDQVHQILIDSAVRAATADAAWIEINNEGTPAYFSHNIDDSHIFRIRNHLQKDSMNGILNYENMEKRLRANGHLVEVEDNIFHSILAFPIVVKDENIGMLVLLKEVRDGFNKELTEITNTFVNQAGISIESFRMMSEALVNERYKEELKIAKQVQAKLLPKELDSNEDFNIASFTEAADEVGGDYYDSMRIDDDRVAIIIGDVSGKGTSAAFHMSQLKGVFHSLAQLNLSTSDFLAKANIALSSGLDKTSFITISYFVINQKKKEVEFVRAGHCPTLYYKSENDKASYFSTKGLGLGIIRNNNYLSYIEVSKFNYKPEDVLVLYTDGITEAKNLQNEEFGYERLQQVVQENAKRPAIDIQNRIIEELYSFCGNGILDDDYTAVIVKFK